MARGILYLSNNDKLKIVRSIKDISFEEYEKNFDLNILTVTVYKAESILNFFSKFIDSQDNKAIEKYAKSIVSKESLNKKINNGLVDRYRLMAEDALKVYRAFENVSQIYLNEKGEIELSDFQKNKIKHINKIPKGQIIVSDEQEELKGIDEYYKD